MSAYDIICAIIELVMFLKNQIFIENINYINLYLIIF